MDCMVQTIVARSLAVLVEDMAGKVLHDTKIVMWNSCEAALVPILLGGSAVRVVDAQ